MGNKFKNKNWFICKCCGYHGDEESLREKLYVTDVTDDVTVVECPRCNANQIRE